MFKLLPVDDDPLVREGLKKLILREELEDKAGLLAFFDDAYSGLESDGSADPDTARNVTIELPIRPVQAESGSRPGKLLTPYCQELPADVCEQRELGRLGDRAEGKIAAKTAHPAEAEERGNPIVKDVLAYIHAHYEASLSLKTLADRFGVNAAYLGQLFKRETGKMFTAYVNGFRVEQAKRLLAGPPMKLREVSEKVGYVNAIYFSRIFRKIAGVSPWQYKLSRK